MAEEDAGIPTTVAQAQALAEQQKHKTGSYTIEQMGVASETFATALERMKEAVKPGTRMDRDKLAIWEADRGSEVWNVRVPKNYDPAIPAGVLVFINAGESGKMPRGWDTLLDERNLIYIGADNTGNPVDSRWRFICAIEAARLIRARYLVDDQRVYISGTSGGGRCASYVAINFPDVFSGGLYLIGCNVIAETHKSGPKYLALASKNRYAIITGEKDFNREGSLQVVEDYRKSGFASVTYLEVPGMGHNMPPADWIAKGLAALDQPIVDQAEKAYKRAQSSQKIGRLGAALADYATAASRGFGAAFQADAAARLTEIRGQYDAAVAGIEGHIQSSAFPEAAKALAAFRRDWAPAANEDAIRLSKAITEARTKKPAAPSPAQP